MCWMLFFSFFFFNLTYSRWTSSLPSCLWSLRIFPSLPGSRLTIFLSRCKFSTLTTRQPMVEFYLLTFPRFPLRKKEHKSYFGKNRTHDFRTSRCADYLLDATALIITVTFVFTHRTEPLCGGFLDKNHVHAYRIRFWSTWRARCFWFSGKRKMKIEAFSPLPPPPPTSVNGAFP